MAGWNQAVISVNELEPVQAILELIQEAKLRAIRILKSSEVEYQNLRNSEITEGTDRERRFLWLHWQREALQRFIAQQTLVIENLLSETNNVFTDSELLDTDSSDTDE